MQRALILVVGLAAPITAQPVPPLASGPAVVTNGPQPRAPRPRPIGETREVEIVTSDDLKLGGVYYEPKGKRAPAVLLVHDAGADRSQLEFMAERLQRQGFGVLSIDLRGHGASRTSKFDWGKLDDSGRKSMWQLAPRDLKAAADWVLSQSEIHSTNLSLLGYGSGCALVARHARDDENVISMTLLSPKAEAYGFDVESDLQDLDGLPTYVVDRRNDETERLVNEANALAGPNPYIDHWFMASKNPTVLDDRKLPGKVSAWIAVIASPRKGRN